MLDGSKETDQGNFECALLDEDDQFPLGRAGGYRSNRP